MTLPRTSRSTPSPGSRQGSCCGPAAAGAGGGSLPVMNRCCGKDLGPMEDHEGPSEADIERFGDVTRACPSCKEEVYDDAEVCYHCGHAFMQGDKPVPVWVMATGGLIVAGMLLVLFL